MTVTDKAPKIVADAIKAKAGKKIWDNLSPEARRRLIKTNAEIISTDMARQASRKPGRLILAGVLTAGVVAGALALFRRKRK